VACAAPAAKTKPAATINFIQTRWLIVYLLIVVTGAE
jgi:hypothetical protein